MESLTFSEVVLGVKGFRTTAIDQIHSEHNISKKANELVSKRNMVFQNIYRNSSHIVLVAKSGKGESQSL